MFSHVFVGVTDFGRAMAFYRPVLEALGHSLRFEDPAVPWAGWQQPGLPRPLFLVGHPFDGQPAAAGNGAMSAFLCDGIAQVQRVHAAALANGGSCAGAPGPRPQYHAAYYGGYFRDPDGNKLAVAYHG